MPAESVKGEGIVHVKRHPERVHSDEGKSLGVEGKLEHLWFHEKCFQAYKGFDFNVSCRYCRDWKMKATAWIIPNTIQCTCQCHPQLGRPMMSECKILDAQEMKLGLEERDAAAKAAALLKERNPSK